MPLDIGSRLAHYDVTAKIGEGGMGEVYRARDTRLDRTVAIKVLPDESPTLARRTQIDCSRRSDVARASSLQPAFPCWPRHTAARRRRM